MTTELTRRAARFQELNQAGRLLLPNAWDAADLVFVPLLVDTTVIARLVGLLHGPISVMALPGAPSANALFAAGVARVSIGQMGLLAALGTLRTIAAELRQHGTWRSIERTFYGFGEAEALFAGRSRA